MTISDRVAGPRQCVGITALTKFRRIVGDYEALPATDEAMDLSTAATWQLNNRLTR